MPETKTHTCYAPRCRKTISVRLLMCKPHWNRLPSRLKRPIWKHYRDGQEITGNPSRAYVEAIRAAANFFNQQLFPSEPLVLFDNNGGPSDQPELEH